jgi:predicted metallopeptidase
MTAPALKLPEGLQFHEPAIAQALGVAVPGAWPEDERILPAEQPQALGTVLVDALHRHLVDARIAWVFVKDKRERDVVRLGHAAKASTKVRFLAAVDYVIELNWTAWCTLSPAQRIAIVDHELCHCAGKDANGHWMERGHDVEEFGAIVGRWGLWKDDLKDFGRVVARQIGIFD